MSIRIAVYCDSDEYSHLACKYLQHKLGGEIMHLNDSIKVITDFIQTTLNKSDKNTELTKMVRDQLKVVYGNKVWINDAEQNLLFYQSTNIFVPDLKFRSELKMLKKNGFFSIYIKTHTLGDIPDTDLCDDMYTCDFKIYVYSESELKGKLDNIMKAMNLFRSEF
jgi:hypothetical protein